MEGLVGQQQVLLLKLEGVSRGVLEGELEDAPENELGNGVGAEYGIGEEALKRNNGKGKEKAL
ncbi:hypothetical protein ID866_9699 [Astraeus odoratus]|nr:hypothetical protein ID866_9699 [Astraeus odoratus]